MICDRAARTLPAYREERRVTAWKVVCPVCEREFEAQTKDEERPVVPDHRARAGGFRCPGSTMPPLRRWTLEDPGQRRLAG